MLSYDLLKLPDDFDEWYQEQFGEEASDAMKAFMKRELFHAVLHLLFSDPAFIDAYETGILILFPDGIVRRVFPRFFTYSADYPER
jgi:hypothetical protein